MGTKVSKNFTREELCCKHCGDFKTPKESIDKLQLFRDNIRRPVHIISGYRCSVHNRQVGGAPLSLHVQGIAFDINVPGATFADLVWLAKKLGYGGIGIYPDYNPPFVHIDTRKNETCWVKYAKKNYQYMSYTQLINRPEINQVLK